MLRVFTVIMLALAVLAIPCSADSSTAEKAVTDPQTVTPPESGPLATLDFSPPWAPAFATQAGEGVQGRSLCTAQATCEFGPSPISCAGSNNCTTRDQNCQAGIRGWVNCDGNIQYCDFCPTCQDEPCNTDEDCQIGPSCGGCTCVGKYSKSCSCY